MIGQLNQNHDRSQFDCGVPALNDYLQRYAAQHAKRDISRTYVMTDGPEKVIGFYTLSTGGLAHDAIPRALHKRYPRHPIPVVRLGRLAVDVQFQSRGAGKRLLVHALEVCLRVSEIAGMAAVLIDAKDEQVKQFYLNYEFESLPDQPLLLWLPLSALKRLFS